MTLKTCSTCNRELDIKFFYTRVNRAGNTVARSTCKACDKEAQARRDKVRAELKKMRARRTGTAEERRRAATLEGAFPVGTPGSYSSKS